MDAALVINGKVDTVYRNADFSKLPEPPPGALWVDAPAGQVFGGFSYADGIFTQPPRPLSDLKAVKLDDIRALAEAKIAAGAPVERDGQVLHVALDDGSRADMGGMATTAVAAAGGAVPWPESYQIGWITVENIRIPLPTPADGLSLAAAVGDYYARVKQHARDLKDAVLAASDKAALDAIDIHSGWPGT